MATILVVDDHPSNRQFLMTLLSYKGYRLVQAADGAEGLAVARAEHPDLVITDILMPTMDGYEFVRHLRADPTLTHTPVVFWSVNYLEREARTLASSCGVSHILIKPCEPQEVLRTVDAALGPASTPAVRPPPAEFDREELRVGADTLAQKVEELSTVNLKLDALVETGQRLALERDLPQLLEDYCRAARDIIGAKWVAVGMLEEDGHTLHHFATAGLASELTATISPPQCDQGIFRELVRERGVHRLHGLPGDPQAAGLPSGYPPVHSFLGAAIFSPMHVYGCLCFADKLGADAFSADDERLATTLAAQLAVAYENAQLYTELARRAAALEQEVIERQRAEARVQQQLARLALLHQITRAIGERQDLDSIVLVVLRHLEQDLPLAFACLCLGAPGSDTVTVTAVGPASQALAPTVGLEGQVVLSLDQTGLRACVPGQTVSVLDTAQESSPLLQRLAQAGLRSLIATPLVVEASIFGLLLVARREPQGFSSGEGEFLRQLSEQVALAAHQASLYAKLQHAYDDLHQSQQAVMQQERLRALGQMASGIAHDINNAISPITLYVESLLASDATLSARAREYLTTVQQAANDVAHTVARLREFYRQPIGLQEALHVDLNQIIPQVVELTRAKWRDEPQRLGVTITVHTALQAAGLPPIVGVESELREALINLVFNAVDAMPHGGRLTLQTRATATNVVVEVIDTGIGMDETTRQRCLEPFYTTKEARGTGLGLAMVYGVTERHAAQLVIESAVGQGTTMCLLFPIALPQGERDVQPAEVAASPPPLRILVVDDEMLIRRLLQDVLQTEGHVVTVVERGRVALAALQVARERQAPFDVVITDLGMPEMDGREVARGVKQAAPDTPVIMLTGWGQALQHNEALPPHVDHLLSKPPGLQELRAALRAVARPAGRKDNDGHN